MRDFFSNLCLGHDHDHEAPKSMSQKLQTVSVRRAFCTWTQLCTDSAVSSHIKMYMHSGNMV